MSDLRVLSRLQIGEAERLGHNYIGCEHLLLGLLPNEDGDVAKVLGAHGVTPDEARRRIAEICGDGGTDGAPLGLVVMSSWEADDDSRAAQVDQGDEGCG